MWPIALIYAAAASTLLAYLQQKSTQSTKLRKIVMFDPSISPVRYEEIIASSGCQLVRSLPLANSALVEFPEIQALEAIEAQEGVTHIEDDFDVYALSSPLPESGTQDQLPWGISRINGPSAWSNSTGEGVRVALLDTGIDVHHPDLKDNIEQAIDATGRGLAVDTNGHGTHVAGIIAAAKNGFGVVGVAPDAQLISIKVLGNMGRGQISAVIAGLEWCVNNHIRIANLSLGTTSSSKALETAVTKAAAAGLIMVAAAGNSGPQGQVAYPARYPQVIAVGATDEKDRLASFSSRGREVDFVAPGYNILSTTKGGSYKRMSGTSMAAPHITGTIALILSVAPNLSATTVKRLLTENAEKLSHLRPVDQGAGLVNAAKALEAALATSRVRTKGEEKEEEEASPREKPYVHKPARFW